ncbi:hypothetical protein SO802_011346 [Lithocarpus litseifolius]|uniref:Transmembrane protein n=1 Tax=Lithocarpus litseifolius TaxID=425828 RepID=A0AAW2D338_9ROSI
MVVTRDNNYHNDNHEGLQQEVTPVLDLALEATQDPDPESSSSSSVSSNFGACARGFWSIASVTGVASTVLLSFLYVRVQRRHQVLYKESKDRLIREKDEKISQLLLHIAQMNEAFSERRRVPVFRIG